MRIKGIQLAGIAVALAGGVAKDALADQTVSGASGPLATSTSQNITVQSGGSFTLTAGQTALTADGAGFTITNAGAISSNDANNVTGFLLGNLGSGAVTSTGSISFLETFTPADTNTDGINEAPFANPASTGRNVVLLNSGSSYSGSISMTGQTTIEGNNSGVFRLDGALTGDVTAGGLTSVTGDNSYIINLGGTLTGNLSTAGGFTVVGTGASGALINGHVTGNASLNGAWTVTGYSSIVRPTDTSTLVAADLFQSGSVVDVRANIDQGLTIAGIGVEKDASEIGLATASLTEIGGSPAVHISAPTGSIVLGADSHGFGFDMRGAVTALGVYDGVVATGIRIEGTGLNTTTITGGAAFDGVLTASSAEADAYGAYIGAGAILPSTLTNPSIRERKSVAVTVASDTAAATAYGFYFGPNADAAWLSNSGVIAARATGAVGNAVAIGIADNTSNLSTITNSGSIIAQLTGTSTGFARAIDLGASAIDVTLDQVPDSVFTDDDAVDDDAASRPPVEIIGDVRFGTGHDTFNLSAGVVVGDIDFGGVGSPGSDAFNISGGATFTGAITETGGQLALTVGSGRLNLTHGQTDITTANFNSGSVVSLQLDSVPANSATIVASGNVTFGSGSKLVVVAPAGLPQSAPAQTILSAALLTIDSNADVLTNGNTVGASYLYNFHVNQVLNTLTASYDRKSAADLGFSANQAAAYEPIIAALQNDGTLANTVGSITDAATFNRAYAQLMPSYSSAAAELATTAIQQQQSATTNRLATTRLNNLNETSAWAQEIGYVIDRTPPDTNGDEFRGHGFGFALGIDGPLNNGALFGVSASFISSDAEEPARPEGQISSSFGQFNAYLGSAFGPVDLDFVAGAGLGRMRERRFIEIGTVKEIAEARWWAYEGHGMIRASAPMIMGHWLTVTPQASLTYVAMSEQGYDEQNAGALDLSADSAVTQRLWGDLGVEFSARMHTAGQTIIAPRLMVGYRANLITDGGERTFHYTGGQNFTLNDDDYGSGGPLVGVGVDATNGYTTFSLGYEGEFTDQIDRHSLNVAVRFRF